MVADQNYKNTCGWSSSSNEPVHIIIIYWTPLYEDITARTPGWNPSKWSQMLNDPLLIPRIVKTVRFQPPYCQRYPVSWARAPPLLCGVACGMYQGCSRNYPGGGGRKHFFVLWVEGVLLTMCPRGGGWGGNLSWGSRCIRSIVGQVN